MKCIAIKKSGQPCGCKAKFGDFCGTHNKPTTNNNFGQDVKSRAGSTRNGFNNTFAKNNSISITQEQVEERNQILNIIPNMCIYCNVKPKEADDHLIPQCCTKNSIYGHNNTLNKVPSCGLCNGSKGGRVNSQLKVWLKDYCGWCENKIDILFNWIEKNKDYLYINKKGCNYLDDQHKNINLIHDIFQKSCENKEDIMINIIKYIAKDSTLRDKANQIFAEIQE